VRRNSDSQPLKTRIPAHSAGIGARLGGVSESADAYWDLDEARWARSPARVEVPAQATPLEDAEEADVPSR